MYKNTSHLLSLLAIGLSLCQAVLAASRTSPPSGAIVVRAGTSTSGEYKTVASAVAALPNDSSSRSIFIYPGTYNEQVYITRAGPLTIYGYTSDTMAYSANQVTIQASVPASTAGSNDASGTLRIHKNDFKMYNVNIRNNYGVGSQAIAISQYGSRVGLYACGFYGYQDTLYANQGTQVYLRSYIQGATDFIFGRQGYAFFGGNTIGVSGPGWVTASGRESNDGGSYVFDKNTIVLASGAASGTSGKVYLGRPWGAYAKVIFKNTVITAPMNKALWSVWNTGDERTSNILFAEYNTSGSGSSGASRPSFATVLSASQAASYTIATAVGSDYANWVDSAYLV
ncbi:pectinesterase [Collybia nuda]|uniref:Pectinesterase n=1 Tax=Collybia nuda TaxID=64659 RepID=A0A9P5Y9W4_9AGAR|nr:pectinesterase [Collybia nuda]